MVQGSNCAGRIPWWGGRAIVLGVVVHGENMRIPLKTSSLKIFLKTEKVSNLFLIMDVIAFKKIIVLGAFFQKISSKPRKLKKKLEDQTSFNIKMPKSELINSASKNGNNGTEKIETSDDEYLPDFTKWQPYMYKPCV